MKRLVLIVLALSLLCGCSTISLKPTLPDESITAEPTTQPITPEPTESTEPPYDKEVLEGGIWVQTDYSKYSPDELTAKYTRLSEEHIPVLQPSDDYGMLYPFIGSRNSSDYGTVTHYGMMDATGRVVVDAVYDNIGPIYTDTAEGERVCLMWSLVKNEMKDDYPKTKYALATLDGSFVTEHIYSSVSACEEYVFAYIHRYDEEKASVIHVYDAQGNLCLNSEDLPFYEHLSPYTDLEYGNGLFTVYLEAPSGAYIADWEGNLLYGPFNSANGYTDGYAMVEKPNGYYAYLDQNGNYWLDMEFTYAESFYRGYAAASDDDSGKQFLLSAKEGVVVSVSAESGYWNGSCFSTWTNSPSGWDNQAYNTEGELLHEWTDDDYCELIGSQNLLHYYEEGKIVNLKTGEERFLGNAYDYYVNSFEYIYPFTEVPYFTVNYYEGAERSILFDESLREVLSTTGYIGIQEDPFTGKRYITLADGKTQFFDMNAEPILTLPFSNFQLYSDMVLCYDDMASYYYDLEGNLLFCYPYDGIAGD